MDATIQTSTEPLLDVQNQGTVRTMTVASAASIEADVAGHHFENDVAVPGERKQVASQAQQMVSTEIPFMIACIFVIAMCELENIRGNVAPFSLSIWGITFEVASAFGTCGLTLSTTPRSTTAYLTPFSKYVVMIVMLVGRHRGLPQKMDPKVDVSKALQDVRKELSRIDMVHLYTMNLEEEIRKLRLHKGLSAYYKKMGAMTMRLLVAQRLRFVKNAFEKWQHAPVDAMLGDFF